jgi:hypothetical protein
VTVYYIAWGFAYTGSRVGYLPQSWTSLPEAKAALDERQRENDNCACAYWVEAETD